MASLLSGGSRNPSSLSGFIILGQAQAALGNTPTTSTGYTLITANSQTSYASSLGRLNFTFTNTATVIQSNITDGNIIINPNGTGTTYINGPVVIPELNAATAFKGPVKVATTGNVALVGGTPIVVDEVSIAQLDRILVRAQTNPAENGIYVVSYLGLGSNGTWVRSSDTKTSKDLAGAIVAVTKGDMFGGRYFFNTYTADQTLDVDPVNWYQIVADTLPQSVTNKQINSSPIGQGDPDLGSFTNLNAIGQVNLIPDNQDVTIEPTGVGIVTIYPGSVGEMDNVRIGLNAAQDGYFKNLRASSTATSNTLTDGAFVVDGGVGIGGALNVGGATKIYDSTSATSTFSGSLQVAGGLGVNGAIYAREVYIDGVPLDTPLWNGGQISSPFYVANIEEAYNTMTGALKVLGGVGIGESLYVGKKIVLESRSIVDSVAFTMRNTATNGQSYTWEVGGNNFRGQGGTNLREGSLTLYNDTVGTFRLAVAKTTGNLLVGVQTDNLTDKLQVNGSIQFGDSQLNTKVTSINNTSTTVIDSFSAAGYRTAKSLVQISDGIGPTAKFHVVEIVVLLDNIGNVYKSEYGIITTGGERGTFDVDYNVSGNGLVRLLFTASSPSSKVVKVVRQSISR